MGNIATAFTQAWRDYNTDGVSGSGNRNTPKSDARALGATIEANLGTIEVYGAVATAALRRGNGSSASPTAIAANDIIGAVDGIGYHSGGAFSSAARARVRYVATENSTNTAQGAKMIISTTPTGGTSTTDSLWLDQDGSFRVRGALGYQTAVGAGAAATQSGTISTAVTLNAPCGSITTVSQTIAAGAEADFTVNNSFVEANDIVVPCIRTHTSAGTFAVTCATVAAGSFVLRLTNLSGATAGNNVLVINFAIIKGAVT
jgi:hypothetical protein